MATLPAAGQQTPGPAYRHYAVEDGLSSNTVRALVQDEQGFIWIGTFDGLQRFDGYSFDEIPLHPDDALEPLIGSVSELFVDHRGAVWLGTKGGAVRIDPRTGETRSFLHDPRDPASLSHDNVFEFAEPEPGVVWIGTEHGANRLDVDAGRIVRYLHDPLDESSLCGDLVTALAVDTIGTLWLGTRNGICAYDPSTDTFARMNAGIALRPDERFVRVLAAGAGGRLWIGTEGGLFTFDADARTVEHVPTPFDDADALKDRAIVALNLDADGTLWAGTDGGAVATRDPSTTTWTRQQLRTDRGTAPSDASIDVIMEDRTGVHWIGLWDGGLYKEVPQKPFEIFGSDPEHPGRSLSGRIVTAIAPSSDAGVVWVGTLSGLNALHVGTGRVEHYMHDGRDSRSLSHDAIWALVRGPDDDLWIATSDGLNRMDERRPGIFKRFLHDAANPRSLSSNGLQSLLRDIQGRLWVGTMSNGLDVLADGTSNFKHLMPDSTTQTPDHYAIWPMIESRRDGSIWIGTMGGGLNRYRPATGRFRYYTFDPADPASLSGNFVQSLYEDEAGDLWIGTLRRGLDRYDYDADRFHHYTTADGLPHNTVTCVISGRANERWIGTVGGLARLDLATHSITTFDVHDGLPSNVIRENACYRAPDGTLYFGTEGGLVRFQPGTIRVDETIPQVVITGVDVFGTPLALDSTASYQHRISLPHDRNVLTFHVSALHYAMPSENELAYRLEGVDEGWKYEGVGHRSVTYANLRPGTYVFRARASNADGVWNEKGTTMTVVITPPFWQTSWFRFILGAAILGGALGAYQVRLRYRLRIERARLEAENERQRASLQLEHTRRRIARDLHDDIGSRLTSIGFSLDILASERDAKELDLSLSRSADEVYRLVRDLRDTVWLIRQEAGTLVDLVDRMRHACHELLRGLPYVFDPPQALPACSVHSETMNHVLFAFKEILHNVHRHADAGKVDVRITFHAPMLEIRVDDDGRGFDPDEAAGTGEGLRSLRSRADQVDGSVEITSSPGEGTLVTFRARIAD